MEGVLRCVLTCLLGMSAVVMMDTHWMEMECLAMVSGQVFFTTAKCWNTPIYHICVDV